MHQRPLNEIGQFLWKLSEISHCLKAREKVKSIFGQLGVHRTKGQRLCATFFQGSTWPYLFLMVQWPNGHLGHLWSLRLLVGDNSCEMLTVGVLLLLALLLLLLACCCCGVFSPGGDHSLALLFLFSCPSSSIHTLVNSQSVSPILP